MADHLLEHAPLQLTDDPVERLAQIDAAYDNEPDLLTWTEVQKANQVTAIEARPGYDTAWVRGDDGKPLVHPKNYAPGSWRTDRYKLVTAVPVFASDGVAGEFPDKWFWRIILEDLRTGERVDLNTGHMVPGRQSLGDETTTVARLTVAAHAQNVAVFRANMLSGRPSIGGTDANHTNLPALINDARISFASTGPTHPALAPKRRIDWVLTAGGAKVVSAKTVRLGPSDHLGILATIRTPAKEAAVNATSAQKIIAVAKAEVGYHEGRSASGSWNNMQKYSTAVPGLEWSQGQPWCATFVAWCALQAGLAALYPKTASCDVAANWFRSRGRFSEYPAIGAQILFGTAADLNHTGIVIAYDAETVTTVEGNTNVTGSREGDGVYQRRHVRTSARVVGYGYPAFPEGIVSADPAWQNRAPVAPAPAPTPAPVVPTPAWDDLVDKIRAVRHAAIAIAKKYPGTGAAADAQAIHDRQHADLAVAARRSTKY